MAISIQYAYYKNLKQSIEDIEGKTSKELFKYNANYNAELSRAQFKKSTALNFFKKIESARLILVGDFHAQSQSTRSFLRICRQVYKIKSKQVVLVLECFQQKDQKYIEQFLSQKISEQEFLKKIEWSKNWSFPWSTTKPLMKWAMIHHVPVYGMNQMGSQIKLKTRDKQFAHKIKEVEFHHKNKTILVQVGDFHLAEKHLPRELKKIKKELDPFKIFQSPDSIYFKNDEKNRTGYGFKIADFYQASEKNWALMTVLPWVKWQDYLLHLESSFDHSLIDIDFTDHVDRFVHFVTQILKLKISHEKLSVYWAKDRQLIKALSKVDIKLKKNIKEKMKLGQSFFIPELQLGILSRLTVNHLSKIAAQYILYELKVFQRTLVHSKNDFLKMIWFESSLYFLSKLANPKRKTDTLSDIKNALKQVGSSDQGKEALVLALNQKMTEMRFQSYGQISSLPHRTRFKSQSYSTASQLLGGMLGEKIFSAFQNKVIQFPDFNSFLLRQFDVPYFEKIYYELIEIVDSWPQPFQSKYEKF